MSLGPYNPLRHFESMRRELERAFPDGFSSLFHRSDGGIGFPVDVHETEHELVATCSLPGIENREDIRIDIDNNTLSISGVLQKSNEIKEDQVHRQERYYGRFQRSISLPTAVNGEAVTAAYKNGVLEIHIPKREEPKRHINIEFQ